MMPGKGLDSIVVKPSFEEVQCMFNLDMFFFEKHS